MIEKTAQLINEKKLEGISAIRDESDRQGMRIVYELKKDAISNVVLNNLYKYTGLQTSFSVNNVALVKGRPQTLNLKDLIVHYVNHRHEVVVRRTQYELREAEKRAHILQGYSAIHQTRPGKPGGTRLKMNSVEIRPPLTCRANPIPLSRPG
jgi:DNA gyrase subunit A